MAFSLAKATGVYESSPAEQQEWASLEGRQPPWQSQTALLPGNLGQDEEWGLRMSSGRRNNKARKTMLTGPLGGHRLVLFCFLPGGQLRAGYWLADCHSGLESILRSHMGERIGSGHLEESRYLRIKGHKTL